MKMERGEPRLERRPRTEDGQTGRTERDWSMGDDRRDNILDSDFFGAFHNVFSNKLKIAKGNISMETLQL